jgi:ribosomal-protein-alanine N-acetyltransferase
MRAVVDHAAALGLKRLWARAHAGNQRSERLLQRLGFEEEGYLRGHIQRGGERRDCKIFGLLL